MERVDIGSGIVCLRNLLNAADCDALIARAEAIGFEPATINTRSGAKRDEQTRDNDRVTLDDAELASDLWARIAGHVPLVRAGRQAIGLNERVRFYRYRPGQKFAWHVDAPFRRENGEMSLFTFMVYLNEGYAAARPRFSTPPRLSASRGWRCCSSTG